MVSGPKKKGERAACLRPAPKISRGCERKRLTIVLPRLEKWIESSRQQIKSENCWGEMRDDRGDERREIVRQRRVDLYTILYTRWKNLDLDF